MRGIATLSRHRMALIAVAIVAVILAGIVTVALAQPAAQQEEGQQQGRDRGRGMARMMMGARGGSAIAVTDDAVFVVTGNMLYKFDAETLELLAQAEIPRPERPQRQQPAEAP